MSTVGINIDFKSPLEAAQQITGTLSSIKSNSLSEYTAPTRLAPIVLIDKRVMAIDSNDIMALLQTLLSIYSGYYLTAISLTSNIGNVHVMRLLDQFSTDRSIINAAGNSAWLGNEEIDDNVNFLPTYSSEAFPFTNSADNIAWKEPVNNNYHLQGPLHGSNKHWDNEKTIHNITDVSNLVVGKLLDVKIQNGEAHVTIPVHVTLSPKTIEPEDIIQIASYNSTDISMSARWHQWRSGEIRFIKDYLLCQDLIENNKKALLADKTGTMLAIRSKRTSGIFATLISGYASPNAVSSMFIISKQTAMDLELALKGSLKNSHVRNQYFISNVAMMLIVVDTRMERFTLYQRGIADYGEYTFSDIKQNAKKPNGTDIESVIKAYKIGDAVRL